jgi:hypothetical protein
MPKETQKGFITDSPFSYKDPIFFSVPRNDTTNGKKVKLLTSKRKLFNLDQSLLPVNNTPRNQPQRQDSDENFERFVHMQAAKKQDQGQLMKNSDPKSLIAF